MFIKPAARKSGTVGTTVQASTADSIASNLPFTTKQMTEKATHQLSLKLDGSSVLNVYYKLKRYTLRFDLGSTGSSANSRLRLVMNGQTYTKTKCATYEIKDVVLGQYIAPQSGHLLQMKFLTQGTPTASLVGII